MDFSADLIKLLPRKFQRVIVWQELLESFGEMLDDVHEKIDGLPDLVDPDSIPAVYMQYYSRNYGLEIPLSAEAIASSTFRKRQFLKSIPWIIKRKSLSSLFEDLANYLYLADYPSGTDLEVYELWTSDYLNFNVSPLDFSEVPSGWTGDGVTVTFSTTAANPPLRQNSVYIVTTALDDTALEARDQSSGSLIVGNVTAGTINHTTGAISVTFDKAPKSGEDITLYYVIEDGQYLSPHFLYAFPSNIYPLLGRTPVSVVPAGWVGNGVYTDFATTLVNVVVEAGSVVITSTDIYGHTLRVTDDGVGNLVGDVGSGNNTIDYPSGYIDVTFDAPVETLVDITVSYYWQDLYAGRQGLEKITDYLDRYRPAHTVVHVELGQSDEFWRVDYQHHRVGDYEDPVSPAPANSEIIRVGSDFW